MYFIINNNYYDNYNDIAIEDIYANYEKLYAGQTGHTSSICNFFVYLFAHVMPQISCVRSK
jgi:hypothetical protein